MAGKLVDKQLKIIDEAQEKAEQFLKKEVIYMFILFVSELCIPNSVKITYD